MQLINPTLHRRLRPRRGQQSHSPDHKILERLVRRLALLTHVILETRYLRRRIVICIFEGRLKFRRLVVFAGSAFYNVGFGSPLLRCGERTQWAEGLPLAYTEQITRFRRERCHCYEGGVENRGARETARGDDLGVEIYDTALVLE